MYRSILVPLDGSAASEHAIPYALGIARRAAATVQLVHVSTPAQRVPGSGRTVSEIEEQRERARVYLAELGGELSERWEVPVSALVLDGPAATALNAYATTAGTDLIVMTTHGRSALSRLWLGSVADTLVRQTHLPLLLTRPHGEPVDLLETVHDQPFERILITLDGSELAERVLSPALALGGLMGAAVTLLQVIEMPIVGYSPAAKAEHLEERVLAQWQSEASGYLHEVAARAEGQLPALTTRVLVGHPASLILEYAREHAFDLIALATHGRGGVRRMLIGSAADKIVRGAACPVLVYRPSLD